MGRAVDKMRQCENFSEDSNQYLQPHGVVS